MHVPKERRAFGTDYRASTIGEIPGGVSLVGDKNTHPNSTPSGRLSETI